MAICNEIIYLVLDELKLQSDDKYYEEEHIIYLLSRYRSFLLKQRYADIRKSIPDISYQTIEIDIEPFIDGDNDIYLKSVKVIPTIMNLGGMEGLSRIMINSANSSNNITYVNRDRFNYVSSSKWVKNIIYATVNPDKFLYLKSNNPEKISLNKLYITAIFDDVYIPLTYNTPLVDIRDVEFPIESALIPVLVELVVKELSGAIYRPKDNTNDAQDDLSNINITKG